MGEDFRDQDYSFLLRDIYSSKAVIFKDHVPGELTWKLIYVSDTGGGKQSGRKMIIGRDVNLQKCK